MFLVWSMVLVVCAASAIDRDVQWKRYLMDQGPGGFGPGGANPGGDPFHQGGNAMINSQYKQGQCVTHENPCRCSMNYAVNIGCLICNCGDSYVTALNQQPTTRQPLVASTATKSPSTTTSSVTLSSTVTSPTPAATTKTTSRVTMSTNLTSPTSSTTASRATMSIKLTSPTPTITTTFDYCDVADQLCQANCPDGYLVDPGDCTFCICKKDALAG